VREEGIGGLWRGFPLPLITISIVRTISFTIYTSTKRILNSDPSTSSSAPLLSSSSSRRGLSLRQEDESLQPGVQAYGRMRREGGSGSGGGSTPWVDVGLGVFKQSNARDVAMTSLLAGGASGAVVCVGSAPFELVKVSLAPLGNSKS
jgi:hypothetical protein